MTKVLFNISMSLDRFVKASNAAPEQPLGEGGERLHEWAFSGDDRSRVPLRLDGEDLTVALVPGRRTYDDPVRRWGADGPHPPTESRSDERLGPPTAGQRRC